ncbi:uncharacterized protein LOC126456901 [Schistocerca serialis cubense]|uniref:uncharacterized protein LOC126456901 n=1 Tax=Schistocerca serialis cubense TaxID=2023355 RepID=UPI00214E42B4|nr:uncharacterized protein LOC126456901 [Schistocerca serialis cubense]
MHKYLQIRPWVRRYSQGFLRPSRPRRGDSAAALCDAVVAIEQRAAGGAHATTSQWAKDGARLAGCQKSPVTSDTDTDRSVTLLHHSMRDRSSSSSSDGSPGRLVIDFSPDGCPRLSNQSPAVTHLHLDAPLRIASPASSHRLDGPSEAVTPVRSRRHRTSYHSSAHARRSGDGSGSIASLPGEAATASAEGVGPAAGLSSQAAPSAPPTHHQFAAPPCVAASSLSSRPVGPSDDFTTVGPCHYRKSERIQHFGGVSESDAPSQGEAAPDDAVDLGPDPGPTSQAPLSSPPKEEKIHPIVEYRRKNYLQLNAELQRLIEPRPRPAESAVQRLADILRPSAGSYRVCTTASETPPPRKSAALERRPAAVTASERRRQVCARLPGLLPCEPVSAPTNALERPGPGESAPPVMWPPPVQRAAPAPRRCASGEIASVTRRSYVRAPAPTDCLHLLEIPRLPLGSSSLLPLEQQEFHR